MPSVPTVLYAWVCPTGRHVVLTTKDARRADVVSHALDESGEVIGPLCSGYQTCGEDQEDRLMSKHAYVLADLLSDGVVEALEVLSRARANA